jgi:hypothetical protein
VNAIGPLFTRIPDFYVNSLSKSVLKSVASRFTIDYPDFITGAISDMKLETTGTGVLRAGGILNSHFPIVKYAVEGSSLYLCPAERCCQHWNLKKVATDNYAMKLVEQDDPELCENVRGLILDKANKLYVPHSRKCVKKPGQKQIDVVPALDCKRCVNKILIPKELVIVNLSYATPLLGAPYQITLFTNGNGNTKKASSPGSEFDAFAWTLDNGVFSMTSSSHAQCEQQWTLYSSETDQRLHMKLTKRQADHCNSATGLLPRVDDIALEFNPAPKPDSGKPENSLREAFAKLPSEFSVGYDSMIVGAISKLKFSKDGTGIATAAVPPPPGGFVANFKWSLQNDNVLTMTSIAVPSCTQVWSGSFSGSKVVLEMKTAEVNGCDGPGLILSDFKKVTLTPMKA